MHNAFAAATLAALTGMTALAAGAEGPKSPAYGVRGMIEKITPAEAAQAERGLLASVEVAGKREPDTEAERAVVLVMKDTRILLPGKGKPVTGKLADLKPGQRVQAKFKSGPRILIYPPRAAATEIQVLK